MTGQPPEVRRDILLSLLHVFEIRLKVKQLDVVETIQNLLALVF